MNWINNKGLYKSNDESVLNKNEITLVKFKSSFCFFDKNYSEILINIDGLVKLDIQSEKRKKIRTSNYESVIFPLDEALIFPFMAHVSQNASNSKITHYFANDKETLKNIICDLKILNLGEVLIEWALVITWYDLVPAGNEKLNKSNTFQLALIKDKKHTFLIYNYKKIEWEINNKIFALTGYNSKDDDIYHLITSSNNISEVLTKSNIEIPSRWIFRVDSNKSNEYKK